MSSKAAIKPKASIHHFSTVSGFSGGSETGYLYKGVTFRVPADCALGSREHLAIERMYDPLVFFQPDADSEPVPGIPMERYEIQDIRNGDVVVMYRMPYRAKDGKK